MKDSISTSREFSPGVIGWTARDLEDPQIEQHWVEGGYEIVSGVLAIRPPGFFAGARALVELLFVLKSHLNQVGISDDFGSGVDMILDEDCVVVADAVWMTPADQERHRA